MHCPRGGKAEDAGRRYPARRRICGRVLLLPGSPAREPRPGKKGRNWGAPRVLPKPADDSNTGVWAHAQTARPSEGSPTATDRPSKLGSATASVALPRVTSPGPRSPPGTKHRHAKRPPCARTDSGGGTLTLAPSRDGIRSPSVGVAGRARTHTKSRATGDAETAVGLNRDPLDVVTHNTARYPSRQSVLEVAARVVVQAGCFKPWADSK